MNGRKALIIVQVNAVRPMGEDGPVCDTRGRRSSLPSANSGRMEKPLNEKISRVEQDELVELAYIWFPGGSASLDIIGTSDSGGGCNEKVSTQS